MFECEKHWITELCPVLQAKNTHKGPMHGRIGFINLRHENATSSLVGVLLLQQLGDSSQLDVAGTLVDSTNLAVTEHLLGCALADKAHATHPLNR